jgi:hypothetical protein
MRKKVVFLLNENKDRTQLPPLSRDKNKEKWQEIIRKVELFVQKLRTPIYRDHAPDYKGCHSQMIKRILLMMVRGIGVRDISIIVKS